MSSKNMSYPGFFISTVKLKLIGTEGYEVISYDGIWIYYNKARENLIVEDTHTSLLIADVNHAFRRELIKSKDDLQLFLSSYDKIAPDYHWGFFFLLSKKDNTAIICNDIYGIYPLYYCKSGKGIVFSNDFDKLVDQVDRPTIDISGLYDYFLFNYTLKSRTFIRGISQVTGGSIWQYRNGIFAWSGQFDILSYIINEGPVPKHKEMADALRSHLVNNLDATIPVELTLTGGFDSKVALALLKSEEVNFSSFTFGNKASPDNTAAVSISEFFKFPHANIDIPDHFQYNLDGYIDRFLRASANAPMFDTLLNYLFVKEKVPQSNLVTGIMGGELIVGPVLVSELMITTVAAQLTSSHLAVDLESVLKREIERTEVLNCNKFNREATEYTLSLKDYMRKGASEPPYSLVKFLLHETYAKFFGVVFRNMFDKYNIINPLVDIRFLRLLFRSKYSFIDKRTFSKAPVAHYFSRRFYPQIIRTLFPSVLKTEMDRGYNLEDFLHLHKILRPAFNYITRHYFRRSKAGKFIKLGYLPAFQDLLIREGENLAVLGMDIFDRKKVIEQIEILKRSEASQFQIQKLVQLLTVELFIRRYSGKLDLRHADISDRSELNED
jgi:hypothetical protein